MYKFILGQLLCNWNEGWVQNLRLWYWKTPLWTRYIYVYAFDCQLKFSFVKAYIFFFNNNLLKLDFSVSYWGFCDCWNAIQFKSSCHCWGRWTGLYFFPFFLTFKQYDLLVLIFHPPAFISHLCHHGGYVCLIPRLELLSENSTFWLPFLRFE